MNMSAEQNKTDIEHLNHFLKNELSAVESYSQYIDKADEPGIKSRLESLKQSHEARVRTLDGRVRELGGTPESSSGMWGGLTKIIEGGAGMMGDKSALSALEQGEDQGKADYEKEVAELSAENQAFIRNTVLPEQQRSHDQLKQMRDNPDGMH